MTKLQKILILLMIAFALTLLSAEDSFARTDKREASARSALWKVFEDIEINGPNDKNTRALIRFIRAYPRAEVTPEALIKLGRLYTDTDEFVKARKVFQRILERYPRSELKAEALYYLGYCQYRSGKVTEAAANLEASATYPNAPMDIKVRAGVLLNSIKSINESMDLKTTEVAIAALLPITGPYTKFGEDALKGILLAAGIFGEGRESGFSPEVKVETIDPQGKNFSKHVNKVASDPMVLGAIGPLLSATAPDIARASQRRKLPIITLTQKDNVPQTGHYVFRNFITARKQAAVLAAYATETLGVTRFAILYPESRYGTELARHFFDEVKARGAEVVGTVKYLEGQKDFAAELKELFAIEVEERLQGRRLLREYMSTADIEALFIPDYYEAIGQIAPYLAFYNLSEVQLLGSNGWNSPKLLELAADYVDKAVFVDGFFASSEREATQNFSEDFKEVYGYYPGVIEAEAYDATMLMLMAIENSSRDESFTDRRTVREYLELIPPYAGATGDITFDGFGEAQKDLFLLAVEEGSIREIPMDYPVRIIEREELPICEEGLAGDGDAGAGSGDPGGQGSQEDTSEDKPECVPADSLDPEADADALDIDIDAVPVAPTPAPLR